MGAKKLELYLHIPFCIKKCAYCDFLSAPADQRTRSAYVEALIREIAEKSQVYKEYSVPSLFLGGGKRSFGLWRQSFPPFKWRQMRRLP